MKAWLLNGISDLVEEHQPLLQAEVPLPVPKGNEILIKVLCCGICHTELDEIEGRTPPSSYPVIPGHQVVGLVHQCGPHARRFKTGDRVGVDRRARALLPRVAHRRRRGRPGHPGLHRRPDPDPVHRPHAVQGHSRPQAHVGLLHVPHGGRADHEPR